MMGTGGTLDSDVESKEQLGLIPRLSDALFDEIGRMQAADALASDGNTVYSTEVSYLEIYNERVRDLFTPAVGLEPGGHLIRVHKLLASDSKCVRARHSLDRLVT